MPRRCATAASSAPANTVAALSGRLACLSAMAMPGRALPAAQPQTEFVTISTVPLAGKDAVNVGGGARLFETMAREVFAHRCNQNFGIRHVPYCRKSPGGFAAPGFIRRIRRLRRGGHSACSPHLMYAWQFRSRRSFHAVSMPARAAALRRWRVVRWGSNNPVRGLQFPGQRRSSRRSG